MAFAKMTKIFKPRIDWILFLVLLVLTGLFIWLEIDDPAKTREIKPLKIKCNDPSISHPMASEQLIFLKNLLIALGIAFSGFLQIALFSSDTIGMDLPPNASLIQQRAFLIPFWRWIARFLIGLIGALIFTGLGHVNVVIYDRYYATPNFLAICKPHQLDLLCSNPNSQDWVEVTCTTPVQMWMPAARTMVIPKTMVIFYYLMLISLYRMCTNWDWKRMLNCGLFLQAVILALMVGVAVVSVYCNEVHPFAVFTISGFMISWFGLNWVLLDELVKELISHDFLKKKKLPRYWNDVPPKNKIPPVSQQPPTTLLTPCGNQKTSAMMGTGSSKPQKDSSTDNPPPMSIYPKLTPDLYEWKDIALGDPPDSINRY